VSVEISRVAHFNGEGLVAPTEVLHASLGDRTSVYFLNPYHRDLDQDDPREPTVTLVVEEADEGLKHMPMMHELEAFANARYPDARLTVEGRQGAISLKHIAMLTYAAFRCIELKDVAIVGRSQTAKELYEEHFGMYAGKVLYRPGGVGAFVSEQGYVGQREEVVGRAGHALRVSRIAIARYVPDENNKAIPPTEITGF
jgi:hypothetical protein